MNVVFDSDLSDFSDDVEIDEPVLIRPYSFEPVATTQTQQSDSDDTNNSSFSSDSTDDIVDVSIWCRCSNCINMNSVTESKCCKTTNVVDGMVDHDGLKCITEHDGFRANCINIHVLQVAYCEHMVHVGPREENQRIHELYRHLAYRRFTRWVYGLLGKKVRKVIPSCAVTAIRETFPSEEYCGFKYPQ